MSFKIRTPEIIQDLDRNEIRPSDPANTPGAFPGGPATISEDEMQELADTSMERRKAFESWWEENKEKYE